MQYVVHYDVAALIITITAALHFFTKKTIRTYQTKIFSFLLRLAVLSSILEIAVAVWIIPSTDLPIWLSYLLNQAYLITFNAVSAVYYTYILVATKKRSGLTLVNKVCVVLPITVDIVLICAAPWTRGIFYFDEKGTYLHGPHMNILYAVAALYVAASLVHTVRYRDRLTGGQKVSVYFYTTASLITVIAQVRFPQIIIVQFAVAISVLLIYLSLENPEDYEDKQLGMYNAAAFYMVISQEIEREKPFCILGVQVEGLKYINETFGMESSTALMKQIADFLTGMEKKIQVFYLSGFRFTLVLDEKAPDPQHYIDKIRERFRRPFVYNGAGITLTAPISVLSYPESMRQAADAVELIEYTLEEAKLMGNEAVVYAEETILDKNRRERLILEIVRKAIRENSFQVYYQPIYSVAMRRFTSAEALIRLYSEELGFISPEEFIPMAEKNGLILDIGELVFRQVCGFMTQTEIWEYGIESIDVNLSAIQCMQEGLHETLFQIMDEYRLQYRYMNLEITETAAVISGEILEHNMKKLIKRGVRFSMDDFGTGFSNLTSIIRYPFSTIKLDKSMVWGAMENEKAMCVLKYTIGMVKELRMQIIAEGVENQEQAEKLADMGCDFFQGYHYSKPLCGEEFIKILREK